jgi:anaphase-promoting complex subunit 8
VVALRPHRRLTPVWVHAAADAYRQAVDISARDYRAWYGLGQAYELMGMQHYALYYYRRATSLRPEDSRMWCAMGQCYESDEVAADQAAIRCYNRALSHNDREGLAMGRLVSALGTLHIV